jgi:hypothetical protein
MLAISTDMQTPKDISVVSVFVATNGTPKFDYLGRVLPDGSVPMPATLALIQPDDPQAQVHVRIIGFKEETARVLRDVLTTIPTEGTGLLRLPLNFLDDGSGTGMLPSASVPLGVHSNSERLPAPKLVTLGGAPEGITTWDPLSITSRCDFTHKHETSINGQCTSAVVDSSKLPAYAPTEVYGDAGVAESGAPVACFDVATCFAGAIPVTGLDLNACTFSVSALAGANGLADAGGISAGTTGLNVALVTPGTGACLAPGQCFVPLEHDALQGWTQVGDTVQLLPAVCTQVARGARLYAAQGPCAPMVASTPVCEPTQATPDGGVADAGATDGSGYDGPSGDAPDSQSDATTSTDASSFDAAAGDDASAFDATLGDAAGDATVGDAGTADGAFLCVPRTCFDLGASCGPAADGCGGLLQCGTCPSGQICGIGGPSVCGAVCDGGGLCNQVVGCPDGGVTTITGRVVSAASTATTPDPVANVTVYIPYATPAPFLAGVQCSTCVASGTSMASTTTAADGTFTLQSVPAGDIPLVIQLGKWRRQFLVMAVAGCATTNEGDFAMPASQVSGNIPLTAISTGSGDPIECVLRKMGIADTEFTVSSGTGRVHLYSTASDYTTTGAGVVAGANSLGESSLMGTAGTHDNYDEILLPCWGAPATKTAVELANLASYLNAGGAVMTSHYGYSWLYQNTGGGLNSTAVWNPGADVSETTATGNIQTAGSPMVATFAQWLGGVGGLSSVTPGPQVALTKPRHDVDSVGSASYDWIDGPDPADAGSNQVLLFSTATPVGAAQSSQCGRLVFADFHVNNTSTSPAITFPAECDTLPMTPSEQVLEYVLWNMSGMTCTPTPVVPSSSCTPRSCSAQGIGCGPAGDGCGGQLDCGQCVAPQTCGGGGYALCGTGMSQ